MVICDSQKENLISKTVRIFDITIDADSCFSERSSGKPYRVNRAFGELRELKDGVLRRRI